MPRSLKKGPYIDQKLKEKVEFMKKSGQKQVIKTWNRDSVIIPEMVGLTIAVYNGKEHIPFSVIEDMVGHRLGEFSPTTKFKGHGGKRAREETKEKEVKISSETKQE